jgi:hypothetical protein
METPGATSGRFEVHMSRRSDPKRIQVLGAEVAFVFDVLVRIPAFRQEVTSTYIYRVLASGK